LPFRPWLGWLESLPNVLEKLVPESGKYRNVVKVCYLPGDNLRLKMDVVSQEGFCFRLNTPMKKGPAKPDP